MIKVKVHYPWGERDINYSRWIYVIKSYDYDKKLKDWQFVEGSDMIHIAENQEDYESLIASFNEDKNADNHDYLAKEVNDHYWELFENKTRKTVHYIQGFLSDEQ